MRAAVYDGFGQPIEIRDVPDPSPGPGEAVVEVLAVGLCRSDLHGWHGTDPDIVCPHVGGHEFVGRVVAVGAGVERVVLGQRVLCPFVCGCGACPPCRAGHHQVCERQQQPGFTRWGAFAGLTTLPFVDHNAVAVPDQIPDELAALVGCRVSTAYRGVIERGRLARGEILGVHGCGGVGLAAIAFGAMVGAEVIAVDVNPDALALATRLGASHVIDPRTTDVAAAIHDLYGGAHVAVDSLGGGAVAAQAIASLRTQGRHVQIGLFPTADASLPISRIIRLELELLGVHGLSSTRFGAILDPLAGGELDLAAMITNRIALDDVPTALPAMASASSPGVTVVTSGFC